jgi:hypothetical protein
VRVGRHSAPDDDEAESAAPVLTKVPEGLGRHARDDHPDAPIEVTDPLDLLEPADLVEEVEAVETTGPVETVEPAPVAAEETIEFASPVATTGPLPPPVGAAPEAAPEAAPKPARSHSTAADVALVRAHSDVRARCIAALVVPFVLYVAVLVAIGASGSRYLLWIFIPLISAGLLVGAFLDAGHRRYDRPADAPHDS